MTDKIIEVYTDGSCVKTHDGPQCGYGVYFPNGELKNISKPFTKAPLTNQRAELYAIYKALKKIVSKLEFNEIILYTDSMYSIDCVTKWVKKWVKNGWIGYNKKPVKNVDIIKKIYKILQQYPSQIHFRHVRSHTGKSDEHSINNDIADRLANEGREK